ncbi:nuA3 HAT complex component nto1 [Cadophora gregata]|uniref:nuA3 HAT complex component nto1 n=1 Tax=Cadophora gregata TaxID=51156 RepID=UPI0026DCF43E|nr:nuA3 HAT complex component nto1 [Cadophora gregata]KAK0113009.1 nuA3 HAT complex component nto1 [Cadophora gregata]KAK0125130.1 nuA3 HAT complex component nto1 [Cadophora gregata f. sp. sojae]
MQRTMAPLPATPRRPASSRIRTARPRSVGAAPSDKSIPANVASEPPLKRRKYIPGGPGGGGRYVDDQGNEVPVGGTGPGGYNYVGPRGRIGRENAAMGLIPEVYNRRDRSTRTRTVLPRSQQPPMRFTSAAQAAAVVQSDGYKPREERAWEEFHPNLDIDASLRAFSAHEVEGILDSRPVTPGTGETSANGLRTPNGVLDSKAKSDGIPTPVGSINGEVLTISIPGTPGGGKRRPGRPPKDPVAFFTAKAMKELGATNVIVAPALSLPKTPKAMPPVTNINAKERLTLPQPSYRKTDTLARFEDKALGLVRYVDKSMANVGYQESDIFVRPERTLIKVSDGNLDEEIDLGPGHKSDAEGIFPTGTGTVGRVEYDMDEQDDKWLEAYNAERKSSSWEPITREIFEITITKIEKEWHALEKRIPKPNPKPPQTHRPRSSSAAAVNGEPQAGEEQDSKCAICDDGDCENTNAIVFCDGCDLAVHQECYGVPFIPEGQWLCRKCQLIGRGIPTCIFCPNTDGAFKQTNASKWAHLLCAMWIPEVSLGNHTFMEPVMEVEKVPKTRWKLSCYLCHQRMGACIQCGNKSCYQAFHVTCARRARLFLKMKNNHGTLAVLDGTTVLKAFCDKHCPSDYAKENDVTRATREARNFYKKTMRGRLWADSQASALAMAATHRHAVTEHQPDESQLTGAKFALALADGKKKGVQPQKPVWKLPSGAPVIPRYSFDIVEKSLQRFNIHKRKEYTADACRYWTLKREARRGAALLKRLQLQMETFSSMEITRRNFAGMGPAGRTRLNRRIEFAQTLIQDLEKLKSLSDDIVMREVEKFKAVALEEDLVDSVYFPVARMLPKVLDKSLTLDIRSIFTDGLLRLKAKVDSRFYTTAMSFAHDFSEIFRYGILSEPPVKPETAVSRELEKGSTIKKTPLDIKERRRLGKRIIKAIQPQLEAAVKSEAEISGKPVDRHLKDLMELLDSSYSAGQDSISVSLGDAGSVGERDLDIDQDTQARPDGSDVKTAGAHRSSAVSEDVDMLDAPGEVDESINIALPSGDDTINTDTAPPEADSNASKKKFHANGIKSSDTPPDTNGYVSAQDIMQPAPPTPPTSNGDTTTDQADILANGGIPYYLKDFQPEGTSLLQGADVMSSVSEELSEMDDEELKGLGADFKTGPTEIIGSVITASPSKAKKGKAKKKARRR